MERDSAKFKFYFWVLLDILLVAVVLNLILFVMPAVKRFGDSLPPVRTVTVSAEAKANIKPDVAQTSFSVVTRGKNPTSLTDENNKKITAAIEFVKSKGIDSKDIQTAGYNLNPDYEWDEKTRTSSIVGYTLTQTVNVKIRDLSKTSEVIGGLTPLGINQIGGISFVVDDPEKSLSQARNEAFAKAREKAKSMVSANGTRLGRLIYISESSGGYPPMPYLGRKELGMGGAADVAAPTIEPGTEEVRINVSLTYALQ